MLFSVHHHFMASLGSNNFVLSLKVWIQKTDATSDKKIENAVRSLFSFLLLADAYSEGNTRMEGVLNQLVLEDYTLPIVKKLVFTKYVLEHLTAYVSESFLYAKIFL